MTDSTTGGPLVQTTTSEPLEGAALEDFLHDFIMNLTGLAATAVRPRWQPEPANLPVGDWVAFGVRSRLTDTNAAMIHHADGAGYDELRRHRTLSVDLSFYGPDADAYAQQFNDGVQVGQNHDILTAAGMGLVDVGDAITVPSIVKERWLYRVDMTVRIKQQLVRTYGIQSVQTATVQLNTDNPVMSKTINVATH